MYMKSLAASLIVAASVAGTVQAQTTEGRELARLAFQSVDANGDGYLSLTEEQEFGANVFVSMDYDDNAVISWDEYKTWDFGFSNVAEDSDRGDRYNTALKILFDLWDRNDDQLLTAGEQQRAMTADFFQADEDRDGRLSEKEFLRHSMINIAFRAALRTDND